MESKPIIKDLEINVMGLPLIPCSQLPLTGFFRDGCCNTGAGDFGTHTICAIVGDEFLEFSRGKGNDLVTSRPEYGFKGLKSGDHWCLCAIRWEEARQAGCARRVKSTSTNIKTLKFISLDHLKDHQIDLN